MFKKIKLLFKLLKDVDSIDELLKKDKEPKKEEPKKDVAKELSKKTGIEYVLIKDEKGNPTNCYIPRHEKERIDKEWVDNGWN